MKILFLDSWLRGRADGSGSAVAIRGLETGLTALGHEIETLRPLRRFASLDVTRLVFNLTLPRRVAAASAAADLIVGFDFDGWRLPDDPGAPYVVALKGVAADEARFETGVDRWRLKAFARLEGRNARSARRVFVTSAYSADTARAAYGIEAARLRVVPEGLDADVMDRIDPSDSPATWREPVILSVARQYRRKDTPTLLRAFRLVLVAIPAAHLRIVGDGPELASSMSLASDLGLTDSVTFVGAVESAAKLAAEYERARVFALPTRQEGFGIVWLEPMAHGLPIAAVDAGATPEVAPHGVVSLLVPPGDADQLAGQIVRLLRDDDLAERLGSSGRTRAARYDWPSAARAFLEGI
jgi:glycosyltransferase involved in cell wall biosynthesis